ANVRLVEPISAEQRGGSRIREPSSQFLRMRDSVVHNVALQLRERLGRDVQLREWRSQTASDQAWALRQQGQQLLDYETTMRRNARDVASRLGLFARADSLLDLAAKADPKWPD